MNGNEHHLAERIAARDPLALSDAIDLYGKRVYRLVERITKGICSNEDVEECVSDIFVTVWKEIARYDGMRGSFLTRLQMLTKYKALDYRRLRMKEPPADVNSALASVRDDGLTDEIVLQKAEIDELMGIVETLAPVEKAIFYRRYVYDEPIEAIARHTGLTRKAVENRLGRIRNKLRVRLIESKEARI